MAQNKRNVNSFFIKEYRFFIETSLFKLLGIRDATLYNCKELMPDTHDWLELENDEAIFYVHEYKLFKFKIGVNYKITQRNVILANKILSSFCMLSEYKYLGGKNNNAYPKNGVSRNKFIETMHRLAIEKGICQWIIGNSYNDAIERLFGTLDEWSVKTYEGRSVTLGFVIDPDTISCNEMNWLNFMDDDSVAVLTDSIHSVIELDQNCKFIKYLSISNNGDIPQCDLNYTIPIRFTHIIHNYVIGNKTGIFLLSNGDILLAQNQSICFVKRNLKWLNFGYDAFHNSIEPFLNQYNIKNEQLIKDIFASVLDVSFSHSGGIIAVVNKKWASSSQDVFLESDIFSPYDNLVDKEKYEQKLKSDRDKEERNSQKKNQGSREKRIKDAEHYETDRKVLKRNVIESLTENKKFQDINRKLRSELMSLDGACILGTDGTVYSFGAIIQNESGSSGGGRSAATRKLSEYGMAIKISTDGYIELYLNKEVKYRIK